MSKIIIFWISKIQKWRLFHFSSTTLWRTLFGILYRPRVFNLMEPSFLICCRRFMMVIIQMSNGHFSSDKESKNRRRDPAGWTNFGKNFENFHSLRHKLTWEQIINFGTRHHFTEVNIWIKLGSEFHGLVPKLYRRFYMFRLNSPYWFSWQTTCIKFCGGGCRGSNGLLIIFHWFLS